MTTQIDERLLTALWPLQGCVDADMSCRPEEDLVSHSYVVCLQLDLSCISEAVGQREGGSSPACIECFCVEAEVFRSVMRLLYM